MAVLKNPAAQPNDVPADVGLSGWAMDPVYANALLTLTAGTIQVVRIKLATATLITNLHCIVGVVGATLTSGQCFLSLFDSSKALLSSTATQHTAWQSTGFQTAALTVPQTVQAGYVYVGMYSNGSTQPQMRASAVGGTTVNGNLALGASRCFTANTGLTTTPPATVTPVAVSAAVFVGVS